MTASRIGGRRARPSRDGSGFRWAGGISPIGAGIARGERSEAAMANILEITGLTTTVSGYTILNNLDFSVEENELRVLLGPNGAGKPTLIAMISGQFKPTAGAINFDGQDITGWAPYDIVRAGIGRKDRKSTRLNSSHSS